MSTIPLRCPASLSGQGPLEQFVHLLALRCEFFEDYPAILRNSLRLTGLKHLQCQPHRKSLGDAVAAALDIGR